VLAYSCQELQEQRQVRQVSLLARAWELVSVQELVPAARALLEQLVLVAELGRWGS
jgi:hypothetical protein